MKGKRFIQMLKWAEAEMSRYFNDTGEIRPPKIVEYKCDGKTHTHKLNHNERGLVHDIWSALMEEPCMRWDDIIGLYELDC